MFNAVILIGSGRRIQQDVLPALSFLGFKPNQIQIYARKIKNILVRDIIYQVKNIKSLYKVEKNCIVYIAVPTKNLKEIINNVLNLNPSTKIIVDTPIDNVLFAKNFNKSNICVAEDAFFLGKFLINKNNKLKRFNFMFMYKSMMLYHGIAFIESVFSDILFHFSFLGLYFVFCKKGIVIVLGNKKYEQGFIMLNTAKIKFPNLSTKEINLIGGLSDYDSVSYRFLDLKRLGLVLLIDNFLKNKPEIISLDNAYMHFKKSRVLNMFSFKNLLQLLKKIFKLIR